MQIYETLKADHDTVLELLDELNEMEEGEEYRGDLIAQIRDELIPHARAEEAVFYNTLRSIDTAKDVVAHSYKEHLAAEALLRALQVVDKIDAAWKKTAEKLREAVSHHVGEEEGKVFTAARAVLSDEEAEAIGEAFEKLKDEIKDEGFTATTLELVANMMPPRLAKAFGKYNPESRV